MLRDNIALLLDSSAFGLLCELIARLILNPVDLSLGGVLVRDEILGIRLPGKSGGHDNWGFRHVKVPEQRK